MGKVLKNPADLKSLESAESMMLWEPGKEEAMVGLKCEEESDESLRAAILNIFVKLQVLDFGGITKTRKKIRSGCKTRVFNLKTGLGNYQKQKEEFDFEGFMLLVLVVFKN